FEAALEHQPGTFAVVHSTLAIIFAAIAVVLAAWGYTQRSKRAVLWVGAICAAIAGACAYYDAFWAMVLLGLGVVWCLIGATRLVDPSWRARAGAVVAVMALGVLSLWPTLSAMSGGRIPLPEYVREHVDFQLVAGLDLRGGMRLVYTVEVEEAIRDRRDRRYDDMRVELAKLFDLHSGDERPTEETYTKLREFVQLETSRTDPAKMTLRVNEGVDPQKIDGRFLN